MKKLAATALGVLLSAAMLIPSTAFAFDKDVDEWMAVGTLLELTAGEAGKKVSTLSSGAVNRDISNFREYLEASSEFSVTVSASMDGQTESSLYFSEKAYRNQKGQSENIAVLKADDANPWREETCVILKVEDLTGGMTGIEVEMGASEDGPRDYKISYSTDQGKTWNAFSTLGTDQGSVSMPSCTGTIFKKNITDVERTYETVKLQEKIENKKTGSSFDYDWDMKLYDDIYFKICPASDYKVNGVEGLYGGSSGEWGIRSVKVLQGLVAPADQDSSDDFVEVPEAPMPSSVKAYKTAKKAVTLTWKKASPACSYEIYLKKGKGKYRKIKTVESSKETKYVIKNLSPTAVYKVCMCSYDYGVGGRKRYSGMTRPITVNMKKQPLTEHLSVKKAISIKLGQKKNLVVKCKKGTSAYYIKKKSSGIIEAKKKGNTRVDVKVTLKSGLKKKFVTRLKVVE